MFVYDGSSLPGTKTDARALTGDPDQNLQASEFNVLLSASYDIRNAIVSASYFGFVNDSTASLPGTGGAPPLGFGRLRLSGSVYQVAVGGTGVGYRDIPVLDSGSLTLVGTLSVPNITVTTGDIRLPTNGAYYMDGLTGTKFMYFDGNKVRIGGATSFNADLQVSGSITGSGGATFYRDVIVTGSVTASLDLKVDRNAVIGGTLNSTGLVTATAGVSVGGTADVRVNAGGAYYMDGVTGTKFIFYNGDKVRVGGSTSFGADLQASGSITGSSDALIVRDLTVGRNLSVGGSLTASLDAAVTRDLTVGRNLTLTTPFTWLSASFANGWSSLNNAAVYGKDVNGFVHLRGTITGSITDVTGAIAIVLPVGYRPPNITGATYSFITYIQNGFYTTGSIGDNTVQIPAVNSVTINSNGEVNVQRCTRSANNVDLGMIPPFSTVF